MSTTTTTDWQVRFCEDCFGAFDIRAGEKKAICEDCRQERKRRSHERSNLKRRGPTRRVFLSPEQKREYNRQQKARWRAQQGRH